MIPNGIAFCGGGPYGFYHCGVLHYLQDHSIEIPHVAGTSIGSVFAIAYALRVNPEHMIRRVERFFNAYQFPSDMLTRLLTTNGCIDPAQSLYPFLAETIGIDDITFRQVHETSGKTLYINSYNLNTREEVVYSVGTHPDMSVFEAAVRSCSIPFLFSSSGVPSLIDGGMCGSNCPLHLLRQRNICPAVGVHFERHKKATTQVLDTIQSYAFQVLDVLFHLACKSHEGRCDLCILVKRCSDEATWGHFLGGPCKGLLARLRSMEQKGYEACTFFWKKNSIRAMAKVESTAPSMSSMEVVKRDGTRETVSFDKILRRIFKLADPPKEEEHLSPIWTNIDCFKISQNVIQSLTNGIHTSELDTLAAETAISYTTLHPDYGSLAARIEVSNLQKGTTLRVGDVFETLFSRELINEHVINMYRENASLIEEQVDFTRDYLFDYFGIKTLLRSYLATVDDRVIETPQHMWMRVSIGIHDTIEEALETYHMMSTLHFTHATPTLFNSGTNRQQMSSCFLVNMEDSITNIYKTLSDCAHISKWCGGIGLNVSNIRSKGSLIKGTNGKSSGIAPMLRVFNDTARYVNQGGKRLGSFAMYIEPWHGDIMEFLDMKKNVGNEHERARDLFYALWIPDLFMERVKEKKPWSLFSPADAPGLTESHGEEFRELYERYEAEGRYVEQVNAADVWVKILDSQIETGTPYMMYKDACNGKSNQQNLGTIQCSNLCSEIVQYTDAKKGEVAVCNLASVSLTKFAKRGEEYDTEGLMAVVRMLVRNLNKVIDKNFYPIPETRHSNMKHRPMGIGVQGLADVFATMGIAWESDAAKELNKRLFAAMYYAAIDESCKLAKEHGAYETFPGSPASKGLLQYHMWGVEPTGGYDWKGLEERVQAHGLRNSLLVALMPTASTGQILGNNECIEPFTNNIYVRRVLSGEFVVINKHLVRDLLERDLWNQDMKDAIVSNRGSIQNISDIPKDLKDTYKTVWEIPQKTLIQMAADRGPYVCQHQSLNLFVPGNKLTFNVLSAMHMYNWQCGNKGSYYLRSQPAASAIPVTLSPTMACESCSA